MNQFDFLNSIQPIEETAKPRAARTGNFKSPENADLRVCRNGAVFPSKELTERLSLEYQPKDSGVVSNGFDVFISSNWTPAAKWPTKVVLIGAAVKGSARLDLFNLVKRSPEGIPETSVLEQGSASFGKELLMYLEEAYGVTPNEEGYIDLNIRQDIQIPVSSTFIMVPKKFSRGDKAGSLTYEKREHMALHPLAVIDTHVSAPKVEDKSEETPDEVPAPELTTPTLDVNTVAPAANLADELPGLQVDPNAPPQNWP